MYSEKDDHGEVWQEDANDVDRNNEAEAKLYAASKNRKKNMAPKHRSMETPPPLPPQPPLQHSMNVQQVFNPNTPQPSTGPPLPQQQQLPYSTGTFPSYQRNPQNFHGSVPRIPGASAAHHPRRLKVPAVLTTPPQRIGVPGQNFQDFQPPAYYPPPPPGYQLPGGMPGAPGGQMMPIMQQPGMQGPMGVPRLTPGMTLASYDNGWAIPSQSPINCPPGLEYLAEIDQLLIHQQIELFELITGFETKNKYMIRNTLGQSVFYAGEESGCCNRQCMGPLRAFDLNFYDHYGNVVMHMYRPLRCACCCCPCCLQTIEVSAPPGNVIGSIHQNWSVLFPRFSIKDATGTTLMKIHGPFLTMSCRCKDVDFKIKSPNGKMDIGKVTKQWSGFVQEAFTDTDNFSVTFPMDMDITAKALLLASVFLIDFMYYETNNN